MKSVRGNKLTDFWERDRNTKSFPAIQVGDLVQLADADDPDIEIDEYTRGQLEAVGIVLAIGKDCERYSYKTPPARPYDELDIIVFWSDHKIASFECIVWLKVVSKHVS